MVKTTRSVVVLFHTDPTSVSGTGSVWMVSFAGTIAFIISPILFSRAALEMLPKPLPSSSNPELRNVAPGRAIVGPATDPICT